MNNTSNNLNSHTPLIKSNLDRFTAQQWNLIFVITTLVLLFVSAQSVIVKKYAPDQFLYLAENFAQGNLSVDNMPLNYPDYIVRNGHIYLPPGPLPAIILIPFLPLVKIGLNPGWISLLFSFINIYLFSKVLLVMGVDLERRKWTILLFFGGTVYFGVANTMTSWYFAHILVTTFLTTCLLLILHNEKQNPMIVGFVLGLAVATRFSTIFAFPVFVWLFYKQNSQNAGQSSNYFQSSRKYLYFTSGMLIPVFALLLYNYSRFGSVLETGYGIAIEGSKELYEARNYGVFSIFHIPRNLFILLFQGPLPYPKLFSPIYVFPYIQPSPLGMGIFYTSPAIFYAFRADKKNFLLQANWLGVGSTLIPLLTHFGTGWIQFGFRYSLDFMPFLIIIVAHGLPSKMDGLSRCLIILCVLINLWGTAWLHIWL